MKGLLDRKQPYCTVAHILEEINDFISMIKEDRRKCYRTKNFASCIVDSNQICSMEELKYGILGLIKEKGAEWKGDVPKRFP